MLPALLWVWPAAHEPVVSVLRGAVPGFVLSGRVFREPFDIMHAGFVMDQPTIGKWLFWFTFMTATALPWVLFVGWLSNRQRASARAAFTICVGLLVFMLFCILSWPATWLVQYAWSMGATQRRVSGLLYCGGSVIALLALLVWAARPPVPVTEWSTAKPEG